MRVNLSLPASTFTKSGTAWETQLIVIDKTGPTAGANWAEQVKNIRHGSATLLEILTLARENKLLIDPPVTCTCARNNNDRNTCRPYWP